ncbi:MAG: serine/threonine protein kinase [Sandaracinaceae bacterium]|jgi:serine/threonine protein kinase|nr:serine/threonine protein kinase [Sandaracinaceae bacterium]
MAEAREGEKLAGILEAGLASGSIVANYELIRKIGAGAMGAVWEARHTTLGKRVAIKTLNPDLASSSDWVARFMREGRAAVSIRHANAVDVSDVGLDRGVPYMVMALLEGESLAVAIKRDGAMSPKAAANIAIPILAALAAAHEEGIVHRDIKPENIFLAKDRDGNVVPTLLDFGVSKLASDTASLTATSSFMGTPYYMSPEQANDSKGVDARTDIYSMGVVLYECLAGAKPFVATTLIGLARVICDAECIPLAVRKTDLPIDLTTIVHAAMRVEREDRYQTARQLAVALLPYAGSAVRTTFGPALGQAGTSGPPPAMTEPKLPPMVSGSVDPLKRTMSRTVANPTDVGEFGATTMNSVRPMKKSPRTLLLVLGVVALAVVAFVWRLSTRSSTADNPERAPLTQVPESVPSPPSPVITGATLPSQPYVLPAAQPPVETPNADVQNAPTKTTSPHVRRPHRPPAQQQPTKNNSFRVPL